jgi:hypothetical protein
MPLRGNHSERTRVGLIIDRHYEHRGKAGRLDVLRSDDVAVTWIKATLGLPENTVIGWAHFNEARQGAVGPPLSRNVVFVGFSWPPQHREQPD